MTGTAWTSRLHWIGQTCSTRREPWRYLTVSPAGGWLFAVVTGLASRCAVDQQ